ncbi:predicted protein [Plenodomus lingam JN3]|uniref:Predicted protein n=1 Tax=Leptosphaeria maculans (strain JN3 / isolate v23.1.3 / race Av1-4-5-6-7-8) TaxID=985895 RepID=E5R590_LEPMJ|nr:predicted protein [Plenodomus lingam JN3]CBX92060.1 predicted protein [Plenodomus lingam JN3]
MVGLDAFFTGEGGIAGALGRSRCDALVSSGLVSTLQVFAAKAGSLVLAVPVGVCFRLGREW